MFSGLVFDLTLFFEFSCCFFAHWVFLFLFLTFFFSLFGFACSFALSISDLFHVCLLIELVFPYHLLALHEDSCAAHAVCLMKFPNLSVVSISGLIELYGSGFETFLNGFVCVVFAGECRERMPRGYKRAKKSRTSL